MKKTAKVYELYSSNFSPWSKHYDGYMIGVAAISAKQAIFFAHNWRWASDPEAPRGVLWEYFRDNDGTYRLWNGKTGYDLARKVRHGTSEKRIREWMNE